MEVDFTLIPALVSLTINLILSVLIFRQYVKTRYTPALLIAIFFLLSFWDDIIYLPSFFPELDDSLIQFSLNFSFQFFIVTVSFLILFFESIHEARMINKKSFAFMGITGTLLGYTFTNPWTNFYSEEWGWISSFDPEFVVVSALYLLYIIGIMLRHLIRFIAQSKHLDEKKRTYILFTFSIFILCYILAYFVIAMEIKSLEYVFFIIAHSTLAIIFLRHPDIIFLSDARIYQILIYNQISGLPFAQFGSQKTAAIGIFGSLLVQQDILKSHQNPILISFEDKIAIFKHTKVGEQQISACLIANKDVYGFYNSLSYALQKFIDKYQRNLKKEIQDYSQFTDFKDDIAMIFKFALGDEILTEVNTLPRT